MATDIGKIFEKEIQKVFRALRESHLLGWHRLADTGAAGGSIVAAQPSDYLLALPAGARSPLAGQRLFFCEVKASEKNSTLTKQAMQPAQRGAISFYRELLKLPYLVLFYDAERGVIQVWDGAAVVQEERISKSYLLASIENAGHGIKLNADVVSRGLADYFALPSMATTLARQPVLL